MEEFQKHVLVELEKVLRTEYDEVRLQKDIILSFLAENIGGREEWKAAGQVFFMPNMVPDSEENILKLALTVARNIDRELYPKLGLKLLELNAYTRFGHFGYTPAGEIFYQMQIPLVERSLEAAVKAFEFVMYEMITFLDSFYPYLLVIINEPDKLTLDRYVELMLEPEELG